MPEKEGAGISIHTPVKGATISVLRQYFLLCYFNPRTREGCDLFPVPVFIELLIISIHAPVKGATEKRSSKTSSLQNFNPRTREGCDKMLNSLHCKLLYFNPRTREGCDLYLPFDGYLPGLISIHAPVKGATDTEPYRVLLDQKFQSTHP